MITADDLLAAGYREYAPTAFNKCDRFFQKRIARDDDRDVNLYLGFRYWYPMDIPIGKHLGQAWDAEAQFRTPTNTFFNVTVIVDECHTITDIEAIFLKMWEVFCHG